MILTMLVGEGELVEAAVEDCITTTSFQKDNCSRGYFRSLQARSLKLPQHEFWMPPSPLQGGMYVNSLTRYVIGTTRLKIFKGDVIVFDFQNAVTKRIITRFRLKIVPLKP